MVYTRLHVLLIDINRIEIGSDSNFGGKVKTSFQKSRDWERISLSITDMCLLVTSTM